MRGADPPPRSEPHQRLEGELLSAGDDRKRNARRAAGPPDDAGGESIARELRSSASPIAGRHGARAASARDRRSLARLRDAHRAFEEPAVERDMEGGIANELAQLAALQCLEVRPRQSLVPLELPPVEQRDEIARHARAGGGEDRLQMPKVRVGARRPARNRSSSCRRISCRSAHSCSIEAASRSHPRGS